MASLNSSRILVGVTGGIAAYKTAELIRRLRERGADVQVVMTKGAEAFITPLTLQAVSGRPVRTSLLDPEAEAGMGHIELAKWADLIVVAPTSADFLARAVHGLADDLLSTLCLATEKPVALVPAMNQAMWHNRVTQANVAKIASFPHFRQWGPASGAQACGDVGQGRMIEPEEIVACITTEINTETERLLAGKTVVITAGPTREAIDPVRYLSNQSSGKMGYAIAQAAHQQGAKVYLISGPTTLDTPAGVEMRSVTSAQEMLNVSLELAAKCDVFVGAAAVADYRAAHVAEQKIKKGGESELTLTLIKNPDIISEVAKLSGSPFVVGFAAETQDVENYAIEKLERKGLDMIVANDVSQRDRGFNSDFNEVTIFQRELGEIKSSVLLHAPKGEIASKLIERIAKAIEHKH